MLRVTIASSLDLERPSWSHSLWLVDLDLESTRGAGIPRDTEPRGQSRCAAGRGGLTATRCLLRRRSMTSSLGCKPSTPGCRRLMAWPGLTSSISRSRRRCRRRCEGADSSPLVSRAPRCRLRRLLPSGLRAARSIRAAPKAGRPCSPPRARDDVAPIQFAFAGMNAHINHDLGLALVDTAGEIGIDLERDSADHRDFENVNSILVATEQRVKHWFATGFVAVVDRILAVSMMSWQCGAWNGPGIRPGPRRRRWRRWPMLRRFGVSISLRWREWLVSLDAGCSYLLPPTAEPTEVATTERA